MRRHRMRGGGWGFTGGESIPGTAGIVSNPMVYTGIGDCRAVRPGYDIPYSQYGASFKGLPGMNGGGKKKRTRKGKGRKTRKQRGGRYGFYPEGDVNPSGQAWWAGSYAPVQRIGCEGTTQNPLNPTHTGSSAPPGAANPNYWMKGGGAQTMAPATYGVGNVDSMYYYAPTGGYANTASTWRDSVGAPVQIQVPYAARAMNQACLTTGGSPPLTGALQKGGRRSRKQQRGGFELPKLPFLNNIRGLFGRAQEPAVVGVGQGLVPGVNGNGEEEENNNGMNESGNGSGSGNGNGNGSGSGNGNGNGSGNGTTTGMNGSMNPPQGGRRHKKSRKHRKGHKGRKH